MRYVLSILSFVFLYVTTDAQDTEPDFRWSRSYYYNLNVGENIIFDGVTIHLIDIDHQYSDFLIEQDTIRLRVARRSLPVSSGGFQIFVADNRNVANLTPDDPAHGLLKKDALICVSKINSDNWLVKDQFIFPVSFNHGFIWKGDEDSYIYSLTGNTKDKNFTSYSGIGIDLNDARGKEKHWLLAIENSSVVWVEEPDKNTACVLLASSESPGVYYVYDKLYAKNLEVRKGQKLERGELVGTAWGDDRWGYLQFAVVYAETAPDYQHRFDNCVNFFPQLFGLYYDKTFSVSNFYTKGKIEFGRSESYKGNAKNASAFEEYLGKGWKPCSWNTAEKLECVSVGQEGNVRLSKTLFKGTTAECKNPTLYCEYEINVRNGVYRIRSLVGDVELESWQKVEFENVVAGIYSLAAGEQQWSSEKVVTVADNKLTVRIYFDETGHKVAGLSELVFQQAY